MVVWKGKKVATRITMGPRTSSAEVRSKVVCESGLRLLAGRGMAVVWILLWDTRHADPEARPLVHTLEDEIESVHRPVSALSLFGVSQGAHSLPFATPLFLSVFFFGHSKIGYYIAGRSASNHQFSGSRPVRWAQEPLFC